MPTTEKTEKTDVAVEAVDVTSVQGAIKKFSPIEAEVAAMKEKFLSLQIKSLEDKDVYKQVVEARKFVKLKRVATTKTKEKLNESALLWQRTVNNEEKRIIALLKPIEDYLSGEEEKFEKMKADEKARKEQEEEAKVNARFEILIKLKMQYTGNQFILEELYITNDEIAELEEDAFNAFIVKVKPVSEARAAKEAQAALDKKQEDERLEQQRIDQEYKQKEIEAAQKKLDDQLKEQQDQINKIKKMKLDARVATLSAMGMKSNGTSSDHASCSIAHAIISDMSDEDFENAVRELKEKISNHEKEEERKKEEAAKEKVKKEKYSLRRSQLMAIGLLEQTIKSTGIVTFECGFDNTDDTLITGEQYQYVIEGKVLNDADDIEFETALKEAREAFAKVTELNNSYSKVIEQRKEAARAARQEELKPDKERLLALADAIRKIEVPDLKSGAAKSIALSAKTQLNQIAREVEESNDRF